MNQNFGFFRTEPKPIPKFRQNNCRNRYRNFRLASWTCFGSNKQSNVSKEPPLNNDHPSITTIIFGSLGWSLYSGLSVFFFFFFFDMIISPFSIFRFRYFGRILNRNFGRNRYYGRLLYRNFGYGSVQNFGRNRHRYRKLPFTIW